MANEAQQAQQQQMMASLTNQAGQLAKSPVGEQMMQQMNAPGQEAPAGRRRARNSKGHFLVDDPTTPVNEAWESAC